MDKIVVKILQGSAVTQTMLGVLNTHCLVVNFLWCVSAKNIETCCSIHKVIAVIYCFFGPQYVQILSSETNRTWTQVNISKMYDKHLNR